MELKVWVDGVQRVVCGVTEATTCQEVVIALAQAIGRSQPQPLARRLLGSSASLTGNIKNSFFPVPTPFVMLPRVFVCRYKGISLDLNF